MYFSKSGRARLYKPTKEASDPSPLCGLLALSAAIFVAMVTEFLPGGLLPGISTEFGQSPGEVGNVITVFALSVTLTTAPLAALTRRAPPKTILLVAFAFIGLGNLAVALSPTFGSLLAARVMGAIAHGAFWSVVAAYPAYMVRSSQLGKATAVTAAGGSVAGVLGLPLGNALGQAFGWRLSFGILAGLVMIIFFLIFWKLPVPGGTSRKGAETRKLRPDPSLPAILMVCLVIVLAVGAQSTFGTYNVVWLMDVVHIAPPAIPALLFIGGAASALGVALTGVLYNRMPLRLFLGAMAALMGLLAALPVVAHSQVAVWVASAVMAIFFGGVPVMLQIRMMLSASASLRNLAGALQTTAFNVGIGGGAFLGGLAINHTAVAAVPIWAAIVMGMALTVTATWELAVNSPRRSRSRGHSVETQPTRATTH